MVDISECKTLNDISMLLFGKKNYSNREKVKKYLANNGIDWEEWKKSKEEHNINKTCLVCGKELVKSQHKFCSSSCAAKFNNKQRVKEKTKCCLNCGIKLKDPRNVFCCEKCHKEKMQKDWVERWKRGEENGIIGEYGISKRLKRYFLEKYDNKCQLCGWSETNQYTNSIPLELHHIDGDYANNQEDNLQLLCPNCHSLTQTYKSANKSGRKTRKKYT